ncbi:MAG: hypothetical protein ACFB2W_19230 [Leptolyngbyaceae cyanobacterium]
MQKELLFIHGSSEFLLATNKLLMKISVPLGSSRTWALLAVLLGINVTVVALSVWAGVSQRNLQAYLGEGSVITWLSGLQLLAVAFVSLKLYRLRGQRQWSWRSPALFWLLISLGFVFLAADELVEIHEQLHAWLHQAWNIQETGLTDRIDDAIVGLYGAVAAGLVYRYRGEIKRYSNVLPIFSAAFAVLAVMVFLDILTNRPDILPWLLGSDAALPVQSTFEVLEEFCKLVVESLCLAGMYRALRSERRIADRTTV